MSDLGVGHVATCTPTPHTLARRPLHLSRSLAHILEIWTADIISAVEFDSTGNYLATGDKGGRVVLFERNDMVRSHTPLTPLCPLYRRLLMASSCPSVKPTSSSIDKKKSCEYKFYTEFQSHEPEFDYLKSLEIEEKINKIRWCKRQNSAHFLLSTNGTSLSGQHRRVWSISYFRVLRRAL